jgi:hypothetical protein
MTGPGENLVQVLLKSECGVAEPRNPSEEARTLIQTLIRPMQPVGHYA